MASQPAFTPEYYEVERILQRGQSEGQRYYLVKWKGFSDEEATWEPEANLSECRRAIDEFERIMKIVESQDLLNNTPQMPKRRAKNNKKKNDRKTPIQTEVKVKKEPKKEGEAKRAKDNLKSQSKTQICLNLSSDSKNQLAQKEKSKDSGEKSKNQKYSVESCLYTSESNELEPTTSQTVPNNRKTVKQEQNDQDLKNQQIKSEIFLNQKNQENQSLRLEHAKQLMNVEPNQTAIQTKGSNRIDITEKTGHMNSLKRNQMVQNYETQETEKVPEIITKKRLLSLSEDPVNVLENKKEDMNSKKNQLRISHNLSENFMCSQTKKEERKIFSIKRQPQKEFNRSPQIQQNLPAVSHRSRLCEDEFGDYILEIIDELLPPENSVKSPLSKVIAIKNFESLGSFSLKFIDLTKEKFKDTNARIFSYVLSKYQVDLQDEKGDFIYSRIGGLIKGFEQTDGKKIVTWICLMIDNVQEGNQFEEKESVLKLVRVDDLEESLWKKLFRRFLMKRKGEIK